MVERRRDVEIKCRLCSLVFNVTVNVNDFMRWLKGANIQDVMPYLDSGERELLMSQTCNRCFDNLTAHENDFLS